MGQQKKCEETFAGVVLNDKYVLYYLTSTACKNAVRDTLQNSIQYRNTQFGLKQYLF